MLRTILPMLLFASSVAYGQAADTSKPAPVIKENYGHQLTFSFDASQPIINAFINYRQGYEFATDYYLHKELYLAAEGGFGSATVAYDNLSYTSSNSFVRAGVNRCILTRNSPDDWDAVVIGARAGAAFINRSAANYYVADSLWGRTPPGKTPASVFTGYWFELTGGMRMEVIRHVFLGYMLRGKFMLNASSFQELSPIYIAGYGRGDKNVVFDFNFYVSYGIRWKKKK